MMIAGRAVSLPGGRLSDRHLPSRRRRGGAAPQPDLRLTRAVAGTLRLVSKTGAMTRGPGKGRIINMKAGITTETLKQESSRLQLRVARGALWRTRYPFQVPREVSRGQDADKPSRHEAGCYSRRKEPRIRQNGKRSFRRKVQASPSVGEYSSDCTITPGDLFEVYLRNR